MPKFNRKPVEVEAIKFEDTEESILAITNMIDNGGDGDVVRVDYSDPDVPLLTVENEDTYECLAVGEYLVKDSDGNLYVWSSALFELTHEEVNE